MKVAGGIVMIMLGLALGLYVGVYVMLIGGIIDVANQINMLVHNSAAFNAIPLLFGVAKIIFACLAGFASAMALIIPGGKLIITGLNE